MPTKANSPGPLMSRTGIGMQAFWKVDNMQGGKYLVVMGNHWRKM